MGCCRVGSNNVESEEQTDAPKALKNGLVPKSQRKCRDVLCCALFLVYWVGMVVVTILAVHTGKPLSLVYGKDYNGDVCGDGNLTDRQLTAYPRLDQDLLVALTAGVNDITAMQFFGVCVASCPMAGATTCTYDNSSCWVAAQDSRAVLFRCIPVDSQNETVLAQTCVDPVGADPECTNAKFVHGECSQVCHTKRVQKSVWEVEATTLNPLMEQLQGNLQVLGRFLNDMSAAKWLILLAGGVGAMVLGLVWLLVLQFFAGCMVWLTCFLVLIALVLMSLFCSFRAGIIDADALSGLSFLESATSSDSSEDGLSLDDLTASTDSSSKLQFQVASYVLWFVTALVFVVLVAMHKRIHIAIAIIKESSKAIKTMPMLLLWPLVPTLLFVALVIYSVAVAACLISSEDLTSAVKDTTASSLTLLSSVSANATASIDTLALTNQSAKTTQQVLLAYHLFGFLWTNQLVQAISICAIAGSVAQFYWSLPDERGKRKLEARFPMARAVRNTFRFSLGSLCFGSFVIAFVQFLRIVLEYINHNTKQLQEHNKIVKVAFLVVRCCLWCFEKCLKFLSKNAYIVIAMKGSSFCAASVESFRILLKNLARVAVVNSISFFLLLLVRTTITLAVGVFVFAVLSSSANAVTTTANELAILSGPVTSPMAPVLVACVLAWLVASAFANVYDTAIDTILLCFCEDTDMNGESASEYMSNELKRIMGARTTSHKVIRVGSKAVNESSSSPQAQQQAGTSNKVHIETEI